MSMLANIKNLSEKLELRCPVCLFMSRDFEDLNKVLEDGACCECYTNFRYIMADRWDNGDRPSVEDARAKMTMR